MNILSTSFLVNGLILELVSGINPGRDWARDKKGQTSEKVRVGLDDVSNSSASYPIMLSTDNFVPAGIVQLARIQSRAHGGSASSQICFCQIQK